MSSFSQSLENPRLPPRPLVVEYRDIDDGYRPSHFTEADGVTKIAHYNDKFASNFLSVFDNLLSPQWADRIYKSAVVRGRPWGVYISTADALDSSIDTESLLLENPERAMALEAVRRLVFERGAGVIGSDRDRIHGTVVWCLSSGLENEVQYHIDYAELFRYETNVIHPPLYAGTCQVSPFAEKLADGRVGLGKMEGGDFMANTSGLDHYKKFGYKCRLQPPNSIFSDMNDDSRWITVKYNHNRGILHDGDFPHLSTKVVSLPQSANNNSNKNIKSDNNDSSSSSSSINSNDIDNDNNGISGNINADYAGLPIRRVILGFNCFSEIVKSCCERAPEHSDAFNRTVKLYQTLSKASNPNATIESKYSSVTIASGSDTVTNIASSASLSNQSSNSSIPPKPPSKGVKGVTAADLKKNPALCKMLIMAAKKVKEKAQIEEAAAAANSS